ncbi:MAG: GNAT family N-acetyltransferase [Treponema sp.]|jgi:phosphinothricin acetyltransferase|nr:GNAT family N-acetyltransferase [Treponema sp.]
MLRFVRPGDAAAIAEIYNYYITETVISFDEELTTAAEMEERIARISAEYPWLVLEEGGALLGYAYAHRWHERAAYRYTAEVSIYLRQGLEGRGLGTALMERLLEELRKTEIHALISCLTLPNEGSTALHEKFGFSQAGHYREVGSKFGQLLDVGYWELILGKDR